MKNPNILAKGSEEDQARIESIIETLQEGNPKVVSAISQSCTITLGENSMPEHAPATFDKESRIITVRRSLSNSELMNALSNHLKLARQMEDAPEGATSPKVNLTPGKMHLK
ncbi:MAG TPA: hypothetical protein DCW68_04345 [Rhodospirillaceae bacterium]|nr:MAG: hypothetical protein A2018_03305 [Alphaproteobacteria bacterium GWF2_58_20]HAU29326.1 hypothetical protein [Rhodospirillaceae bacterium]